MTHNHPIYKDGASFSVQDIQVAVDYHLAEIRAVGQRYRHSMIIPRDTTLTGDDVYLVYEQQHAAVKVELLGQVQAGNLTSAEANLHHRHEVWARVAPMLGLKYKREEWKA
jgi:SOS-response transcriptional repressor LexA